MPLRRARIVCTLGPATASDAAIAALIEAGMDVARLNFSHGTHEAHAAMYRVVRAAAAAAHRHVAVLADLQGPKIRLGAFRGGQAVLQAGAEFTITTAPVEGDARHASTTYPALARDVKAGDSLLIDDGLLRLEVLASDGREVRCRVIEGGPVSDHKGINLPGVKVSAPALGDKDADDLRFALGLGVDAVALSFVRAPEDALPARAVMEQSGRRVPLIAKIEKPEAVAALDAITVAFEGVMVARGDLGVEMPLEQVPLVQKRAVRLAREHARPVIVATQMLESMIHNPRPTRAEASDVANAILDGADAVMLSAETSVGEHPIAAVRTMARVIAAVESSELSARNRVVPRGDTIPHAIAHAAGVVASDLGAAALVAFTRSGETARELAAERCPIPLLAFTPDEAVARRLSLVWGVQTHVVPIAPDTDRMIATVEHALCAGGHSRAGDLLVFVAGTPPGVAGATNTVRVHRVQG